MNTQQVRMTYFSDRREQYTGTLEEARRNCIGELVLAIPADEDAAEMARWIEAHEQRACRNIAPITLACVLLFGAAFWVWFFWCVMTAINAVEGK